MPSEPARHNRFAEIIAPLLLVLLTYAIYGRGLSHSFLTNWDDHLYIVQNDAVLGLTSAHIKDAFTRYYVGNFAPIHIISYMIDYSIWGLRPFGFILTNITVHACNGLLYYGLILKMAREKFWALTAAFLFLFHPVQVESVIWISQRKNLLAMFFFLSSLLFYTIYTERGQRNTRLYYVLSVTAFLIALLAKSAAVILPLALLLYDICFLEKKRYYHILADKIPFILAAAVIAIIAMKSQSPDFGGGRTGYHGGTPLATFFTMMPVLMQYLGMLAWPANLSAAYSPLVRNGIDATVVISITAALILCICGTILYKKKKPLFLWYAFFFIGLIPVAQIVPLVTLMNDRYLYFPMLGAAAFCAGGAASLKVLLGEKSWIAVKLCGSLLLILLLCTTWQRIPVWENSISLWSDAVKKVPASKTAWFGLGNALDNNQEAIPAIQAYERALAIDPTYKESLDNITMLLLAEGNNRKANYYLTRTVALYPVDFAANMNLGTSFYLLGDYQSAEFSYQRALQIAPQSAEALIALATVHLRLKRKDAALRYYQQVIALKQQSSSLQYGMAGFQALSGNRPEALDLLEKSINSGFKECRSLARDPDLSSLRETAEFRRLRDLCKEKTDEQYTR